MIGAHTGDVFFKDHTVRVAMDLFDGIRTTIGITCNRSCQRKLKDFKKINLVYKRKDVHSEESKKKRILSGRIRLPGFRTATGRVLVSWIACGQVWIRTFRRVWNVLGPKPFILRNVDRILHHVIWIR